MGHIRMRTPAEPTTDRESIVHATELALGCVFPILLTDTLDLPRGTWAVSLCAWSSSRPPTARALSSPGAPWAPWSAPCAPWRSLSPSRRRPSRARGPVRNCHRRLRPDAGRPAVNRLPDGYGPPDVLVRASEPRPRSGGAAHIDDRSRRRSGAAPHPRRHPAGLPTVAAHRSVTRHRSPPVSGIPCSASKASRFWKPVTSSQIFCGRFARVAAWPLTVPGRGALECSACGCTRPGCERVRHVLRRRLHAHEDWRVRAYRSQSPFRGRE